MKQNEFFSETNELERLYLARYKKETVRNGNYGLRDAVPYMGRFFEKKYGGWEEVHRLMEIRVELNRLSFELSVATERMIEAEKHLALFSELDGEVVFCELALGLREVAGMVSRSSISENCRKLVDALKAAASRRISEGFGYVELYGAYVNFVLSCRINNVAWKLSDTHAKYAEYLSALGIYRGCVLRAKAIEAMVDALLLEGEVILQGIGVMIAMETWDVK